jgi:outer membrane protein assembly factor BamA
LLGPYYLQYWANYSDNQGRILGDPSKVHLDSSDIYSTKSYLGGKLALRIDNRNSEIWPTRGVLWNTELVSLAGMNKSSDALTKLSSDMTIFASLSDPAKVIAVVGLGGGQIFNRNFEYFQAMSLGAGNNNLHGFRRNRYTGQASAYGSLELRIKLANIKSYLFPGPFGFTTFYDVGRVWYTGEESRHWHSAYGGGLYFIPFNLFVMTASVGFTKDEHIVNVTFGTKVNLSF